MRSRWPRISKAWPNPGASCVFPRRCSYPIVATVFGLLNERAAGYRRSLTRGFFNWSLTQGRGAAERLGYVALPPAVAQQVLAALK